MKASRWGAGLAWGLVIGLVLASGCRRQNPSSFDDNFPPETYISGAPAESTLTYYRVHLYWHGADSDGKIDHYEYAVTDSSKIPGEDTPGFVGYYRTARSDSVFLLSADNPQVLGHRFYVRAVDNEGKVDPTPAWAYFVAHDFNFPNVIFNRQIGSWTDRDGNVQTRTLRSTNRFAPTDTIGVGGSVTFSWSGFDRDEGGSVTGYVYRTSELVDFTGGTLADTALTLSFAPTLVNGQMRYYSGNEVLQVRAVDDAGAQTQPDSVRSVVVNFNPVSWIVDPDQLSPPVRKKVFREFANQVVYPSGTTLALDEGVSGRGLGFYVTSFDDPREQSVGADDQSGVTEYSWRRLKEGGGPAWSTRHIENFSGYPVANFFSVPDMQSLDSGDYRFLVRGKDVLGRWGTPETLSVSINYAPFFTDVSYSLPGTDPAPLWIPPTSADYPGTVEVVLTAGTDGAYPDLAVRFEALDMHEPPPNTHLLDPNQVVEPETSRVEEFRARLNGARTGFDPAINGAGERLLPVSTDPGQGVVSPGINVLDLAVRDVRGRAGSVRVVFRATLVPAS